jgi:hypothetical protein
MVCLCSCCLLDEDEQQEKFARLQHCIHGIWLF